MRLIIVNCSVIVIYWTSLSYGIQTWHDGRLMNGIYAHAHFDDLDLDARSQWIGRGKQSAFNYLDKQLSQQ